jgi:hypothetical protein
MPPVLVFLSESNRAFDTAWETLQRRWLKTFRIFTEVICYHGR